MAQKMVEWLRFDGFTNIERVTGKSESSFLLGNQGLLPFPPTLLAVFAFL